MTPLHDIFMSNDPCMSDRGVHIVDGTLRVASISNKNIKSLGILLHVLHVPRLFVNLISVKRLAKLDEYGIICDDLDAFLSNNVHGWKI